MVWQCYTQNNRRVRVMVAIINRKTREVLERFEDKGLAHEELQLLNQKYQGKYELITLKNKKKK